jgi:hypothetical protein
MQFTQFSTLFAQHCVCVCALESAWAWLGVEVLVGVDGVDGVYGVDGVDDACSCPVWAAVGAYMLKFHPK